MAFERRLGASILVLLGVVPLLFEYLPARPELLALPLGILACVLSAVLLPAPRWVQTPAAVLGALVITALDFRSAPGASFGLVALAPLVALVMRLPLWSAASLLVVTTVGAHGLLGGGVLSRPALGVSSVADWFGVSAWTGAFVFGAYALVQAKLKRMRRQTILDGVSTLREGLARDYDDLLALAQTLADPNLQRSITGHGLHGDHLNLAARLDDRHVLLGRLDGDPLATLSAGWGLRACALAGLDDPKELLEIAAATLDEILPPEDLRWVAILDTHSGDAVAAPGTLGSQEQAEDGRFRYEFGSPIGKRTTAATLSELQAPQTRPHGAQPKGGNTVLPLALALASVGAIAPWLSLGLLGASTLAIPYLSLAFARHYRAIQQYRLALAEAELEDRIEARDDVHHQIARLHGGLLPYRIDVESSRATAHRLRGEVLEGSFADMLVVGDRGLLLSGEVAGEGIAARFVGMASQLAMRVHAMSTATSLGPRTPPLEFVEISTAARKSAREAGARLEFPVRLAVGAVEISPEGRVRGHGSLADMIVVERDEKSILSAGAKLRPNTRIYLTPASSRPGPEDSVPVLEAAVACGRVGKIIDDKRWEPDDGGLASLFSLVFDGINAPAHGTLIELDSVSAQQGETEQSSEGETEPPEHLPSTLRTAV